jgi:hypothetical protein
MIRTRLGRTNDKEEVIQKQETNFTEQQIENYQKQYFEIIVQG